MYAIVDIETTGGHASAGSITEIAIFIHDGKQIVQQYETLVNPGMPIPRYIQALTGITNEMVADAPSFEEVAQQVFTLLQGQIFIAHNVNFDYSFLKFQLDAAGYKLQSRKLCTVRLSRKVFPGFPSYSLGNLCRQLNINIQQRHRATGDALATVQLFERIMAADVDGAIAVALNVRSKEQWLPLHLPQEQVADLPICPGVYYFHNEKGKVVYVGKARNIKKRVTSHFTGNSSGRKKQEFIRNIYGISYEKTGTELMAFILESIEIRRLWPPYNNAQKRIESKFGFYVFEDQGGYLRLAIEKRRKYSSPVYTFNLLIDGHQRMRELVREFKLCPKLCFLQTDNDACIGIADKSCKGACDKKEKPVKYNQRVAAAIEHLKSEQPSFVIVDSGREATERSCILMEKGKFYGMGYVPRDVAVTDNNMLKDWLTQYPENEFILNLLRQHANARKALVG
ncbi:DNA polymerase III subunit epsilon [Chitinophaga sp. SYP-B3965]|uniref:exonuclease domain-containing protein n=1 Tax=Chitinophaga sp. SYP-B3965 TaxID=2663120 RepID=UPI001299A188|nr:exonuclease domain-containing protein [Chitinophaga sp. SYP-B3965]MRG44578.1 DNA polymerase III subunit epsilon [Chitinophaga sp. SYP-B3965]